jgi:hypothetical protein
VGTAGALVDARGNAEAERGDPLAEEFLDGLIEPGQQRLLRFHRRRLLASPLHGSVAADDPGQDLRPADVDSDHALRRRHGRRLP